MYRLDLLKHQWLDRHGNMTYDRTIVAMLGHAIQLIQQTQYQLCSNGSL